MGLCAGIGPPVKRWLKDQAKCFTCFTDLLCIILSYYNVLEMMVLQNIVSEPHLNREVSESKAGVKL